MGIYEQIGSNKRKSFLLIFLFFLVVIVLGFFIGELYAIGYFGVVIAVILAVIMGMISYYSGDKIILTISRAKPVTKKDNPYLVNAVEGLAIAAGVPVPKIYTIEDTAMNAFATGRNPEHSSICVTSGLVARLNRQELEGVIAHEMSHIQNYDIRLMMLAGVLVGIVALLSDFMIRSFWFGGARKRDGRGGGQIGAILIIVGILLAILAPIIAQLIKLAISRKREYLADASGALLTRYPKGLADALKKISKDHEPLEAANKATAHLYIANPLRNLKGSFNAMFSTHPPIEERIKRLEAM